MKIGFGKKIVIFVFWLLSILLFAATVMFFVWQEPLYKAADALASAVGNTGVLLIKILAAVLYVATALGSFAVIFSRKGKKIDRSFITVDSGENGKTRISMNAVEQMVRQAMSNIDNICDVKTAIAGEDGSVSINTNVSVAEGTHVPTVTQNIQRAVRGYIELNCGIAVRDVSVSVHSVVSEDEKSKHTFSKNASFAPVNHAFIPEETSAPVPEKVFHADEKNAEVSEESEVCPDLEEEIVLKLDNHEEDA